MRIKSKRYLYQFQLTKSNGSGLEEVVFWALEESFGLVVLISVAMASLTSPMLTGSCRERYIQTRIQTFPRHKMLSSACPRLLTSYGKA
jgi:hypothetical protein